MTEKPMFHFSAYWCNWSRVLSDSHPGGPFVEVNLTPIPNSYSDSWERIGNKIIRVHGTARDEKDIVTDTLPTEVEAEMRKHLGSSTVDSLLYEDILSQIDFNLYKRNQNGGCPLWLCRNSRWAKEAGWKAIANIAPQKIRDGRCRITITIGPLDEDGEDYLDEPRVLVEQTADFDSDKIFDVKEKASELLCEIEPDVGGEWVRI